MGGRVAADAVRLVPGFAGDGAVLDQHVSRSHRMLLRIAGGFNGRRWLRFGSGCFGMATRQNADGEDEAD